MCSVLDPGTLTGHVVVGGQRATSLFCDFQANVKILMCIRNKGLDVSMEEMCSGWNDAVKDCAPTA